MLAMVASYPGDNSERFRYGSLDCLRGVAAFIVMLGHSMPHEHVARILSSDKVFSISKIVISGYQCVILFFVLGGFALYVMFDSMKKDFRGISLFMVARWIRLYPVYLLSIIFSVAVYYFAMKSGLGGGTPYARDNPLSSFSLSDFMGHLTLIGDFDAFRYNSPIWSIVHEMRVSLLFPIIFFMVVKYRGMALFPTIIFSLFFSVMYFGEETEKFQYLVTMPGMGTLHYTTFFIAGALIAHKKEKIVRVVREAPRVFVLLSSAFLVTLFFMIGTFPTFFGEKIFYDIVVATAASGLIALVISFPSVLENSVLAFFGKISFSLYLIHNPCIVMMHVLFDGRMNHWGIFALSLSVSVILSTFIWWAVERPSLRLSRIVRKNASPKKIAEAI